MTHAAPLIRPMTLDDVVAVDVLASRTFGHVFLAHGMPTPPQRDARAARLAHGRLAHLVLTDPDGCVVAVDEHGRHVGVAMSLVREGLWALSLLVVDPVRHARGLGRRLMEAVLPAADVHGLIAASPDPKAIALYASAGFRPLPTFEARGPLTRVPASPEGVRDGSPHDLDLCDELDRANRGAARRPDLELMLAQGRRMRVLEGEGFSLVDGSRLITVSARTTEAAAELLVDHLASLQTGDEPDVLWLTHRHQWAIDVLVTAGVGVTPRGAICVRPDPDRLAAAYIPTGLYL